jgi:hypothetical protein
MDDENQNSSGDMNTESQWNLADDAPTAPTIPQVPSVGSSRRNFLKATLVGTAGLAAVGGAAAVALSSKSHLPGIFPVGPATPVASHSGCISLIEDYHSSNPNSNIVIDASFVDSFGTAAPPNGHADRPVTFSRCGAGTTIYFKITDSNSSAVVYGRLLTGNSGSPDSGTYIDGNNGKLFLVVDQAYGRQGDTSTVYNTNSCLQIDCKKWPIQP